MGIEELPLPWPEFREVWREIPGFEGYEVSSNGRVRSWRKGGRWGRQSFRTEPRPMSLSVSRGYSRTAVRRHDGTFVAMGAHRMLALAFFGDGSPHRLACHIDGISTANSVNNLYWGTHNDNHRDKARHLSQMTPSEPPAKKRARVVFREPVIRSAEAVPLPWPLDREVWRAIPEFSRYEVSTNGRVRSCRRPSELRELRLHRSRKGYWRTTLVRDDGEKAVVVVHRLVVAAFFGQVADGDRNQTRHLSGDSSDNSVNNLYLGTARDNQEDARRHGTMRRAVGQCQWQAKLTDELVRSIRQRVSKGETRAAIAAELGMAYSTIGYVVSRRTWAHVS